MAWKSVYQEKSRYKDKDRRAVGDREPAALPGWIKQAVVCCFILSVLLGASKAPGGLAGGMVSFARGAVQEDLSFDDVKAWVAGLPEGIGKLTALDIRGFWSRAATTDPTELAWPVSGEITSHYGWRSNPETGGLSAHQGIDIDAAVGTKVASVLDGVVVSVRQSPTYGLVIEIEHGGGFSSVYGRLETSLVESEQTVKQGEFIGTIGKSGDSDGAHLHFEIRKDGLEVDPMLHLPPATTGP